GDRLVFPWERDGWTHLYSMSVSREAASGSPTLLTPGAFEVEQVALSGGSVIFNSNQGDLDRRHLWRVAVTGGTPEPVTGGEGNRCPRRRPRGVPGLGLSPDPRHKAPREPLSASEPKRAISTPDPFLPVFPCGA